MAHSEAVTDADIREFFAHVDNYADVPIEDVFRSLERPRQYDDWDWGRVAYEWERPTLRYRVMARGGRVIYVDELDPKDKSRYGTTIRILWGDSSP